MLSRRREHVTRRFDAVFPIVENRTQYSELSPQRAQAKVPRLIPYDTFLPNECVLGIPARLVVASA